MPANLDEGAQRARLVSRHLHENEVLDGVFEVSPERAVAVTSERIMIVSGGGAKGWALKWIPWQVITGVEINAGEGLVGAVHLSYARTRRLSRSGQPPETDEEAVDLRPCAAEDARRMVHLITARRVSSPRVNR